MTLMVVWRDCLRTLFGMFLTLAPISAVCEEGSPPSQPGLWSAEPLARPTPPAVRTNERVASPIDRFVLARLEAAGLSMAPAADKRTLLRRAYFDLLGLPPSYEEVEAFVRDDSPDAYEKQVDKLLESPHYGERWARYWLDLVRYADTNGYERDATKPGAWRYRDYVIDSLNDDKPYNRFVVEQLAGDELPDRSKQTVIATGLMRLGTWDDEPNVQAEYTYERLEDLVHTTSSAFLGLTVKCARCHDHKFDPIRQAEYYEYASAFFAGYVAFGENMGGPTAEKLGFDVLGWTDRGRTAPPLHVLQNGEPHAPLQAVQPGALTLVTQLEPGFKAPPDEAKTTRRRLQLARWITDEANPLTPRVMVNRLWQHHFGQAIVRTPNNFGHNGIPPTHPKLLDWLAAELVAGGWKLKRMHKLIMLSSAYRMAVEHPEHGQFFEKDSSNLLLWHFNRRRLESEAFRDAMLAVTGELNVTMGGPGFYPTISDEALEGLSRKGASWGVSSAEERRRRSIYIFTKRSLLVPLMTTFNFSDTTASCPKRDVTTVAPQALALLNNHFVHGRSAALARKITAEVGTNRGRQIERVWQRALGRSPSVTETKDALSHLDAQLAYYREWRKETLRLYEKNLTPRGVQNEDVVSKTTGLSLWLRADRGVMTDSQGSVTAWTDYSGNDRNATQEDTESRPTLVTEAIDGKPALRFDGLRHFLRVDGKLIDSQLFAIFAVATDRGTEGHRTILSNWTRDDNTVTSVFLGTTGPGRVRFTDAFANATVLKEPTKPFALGASSTARRTLVFQNGTPIARSIRFSDRNVETSYLIGAQGDNGEHWDGEIAELLVFNRELTDNEARRIHDYLTHRYNLPPPAQPAPPQSAEQLALASLCHVLLNTNEFIYVD